MSTSSAAIPALPEVSARVRELLSRMTLEEKLAQLVGYWLDQGGNVVAPMQGEMAPATRARANSADVTSNGIGHYTRVYGTRPVDGGRARGLAVAGAAPPAARDPPWHPGARARGVPHRAGRVEGRPPTRRPLAWGASFDPALVAEVGAAIGDPCAPLGIHQGLAPVLDVIRDPRWGRVDECIGEDPYLVGTDRHRLRPGPPGRGASTRPLKHFLGYSGSAAGRNHAPVQRRSPRGARTCSCRPSRWPSSTATRAR